MYLNHAEFTEASATYLLHHKINVVVSLYVVVSVKISVTTLQKSYQIQLFGPHSSFIILKALAYAGHTQKFQLNPIRNFSNIC